MKPSKYPPEYHQKIKEIISEALDEVYPDMLPEDKALCLNFLRTKIRDSIEEMFILIHEGYSKEMLKSLIIMGFIGSDLE